MSGQPLDQPVATRLAVLLTEIFAPVVLIFALLIIVAVQATGDFLQGLVVGGVAAFFAGGLPYAILLLGIRRGRLTGRHLPEREERPAIMVVGLFSVSVGLAFMIWLDAPRTVYALVVAMVAGVAVALAISSFWKISIHTASAAGTVMVLVSVFGWQMLLSVPLVGAIAWARVTLLDHTWTQVVVGAAVGAVVAGAVMSGLT